MRGLRHPNIVLLLDSYETEREVIALNKIRSTLTTHTLVFFLAGESSITRQTIHCCQLLEIFTFKSFGNYTVRQNITLLASCASLLGPEVVCWKAKHIKPIKPAKSLSLQSHIDN